MALSLSGNATLSPNSTLQLARGVFNVWLDMKARQIVNTQQGYRKDIEARACPDWYAALLRCAANIIQRPTPLSYNINFFRTGVWLS